MKTKQILISLSFAVLFLFAACSNEEIGLDTEFTVSTEDIEGVEFVDDVLYLDWQRRTILMNIATETPTSKWLVRCPTDDLWCTYEKRGGQILLIVDHNGVKEETDGTRASVRESHLIISLEGVERTIYIRQEYKRYITFATNPFTAGPSRGVYPVIINTNIAAANMNFDVVYENEDGWLTDIGLTNNTAASATMDITLTRNTSQTDTRSARVILSGEGVSAELLVTQNEMSGYPYRITLNDDIKSMTFDDALIYNVLDPVDNTKVGEICREWLVKVTDGATVPPTTAVDDVFAVAYATDRNGKPYLTSGFVLNNRGSVVWSTGVTTATPGSSHITSYNAGSGTMPDVVYLRPGGTSISAEPLEADDLAIARDAVLSPYIITDTRDGAANNRGETTETFTYKIVKVGTQNWFAENLKTTRFNDGSPIPTDFGTTTLTGYNEGFWQFNYSPMCAVYYRVGSTNTQVFDANDPSAAAGRNIYGCVYTFYAVINSTLPAANRGESGGVPWQVTSIPWANPPLVDKLSPQGWKIPSNAEAEILRNYVVQLESGSISEIEPLFLYGATPKANITGFSGCGERERSGTGAANSRTSYWTMHYGWAAYTGSSTPIERYKSEEHKGGILRISAASGNTITTLGAAYGCYVRCLQVYEE